MLDLEVKYPGQSTTVNFGTNQTHMAGRLQISNGSQIEARYTHDPFDPEVDTTAPANENVVVRGRNIGSFSNIEFTHDGTPRINFTRRKKTLQVRCLPNSVISCLPPPVRETTESSFDLFRIPFSRANQLHLLSDPDHGNTFFGLHLNHPWDHAGSFMVNHQPHNRDFSFSFGAHNFQLSGFFDPTPHSIQVPDDADPELAGILRELQESMVFLQGAPRHRVLEHTFTHDELLCTANVTTYPQYGSNHLGWSESYIKYVEPEEGPIETAESLDEDLIRPPDTFYETKLGYNDQFRAAQHNTAVINGTHYQNDSSTYNLGKNFFTNFCISAEPESPPQSWDSYLESFEDQMATINESDTSIPMPANCIRLSSQRISLMQYGRQPGIVIENRYLDHSSNRLEIRQIFGNSQILGYADYQFEPRGVTFRRTGPPHVVSGTWNNILPQITNANFRLSVEPDTSTFRVFRQTLFDKQDDWTFIRQTDGTLNVTRGKQTGSFQFNTKFEPHGMTFTRSDGLSVGARW